MKDLRRNQAPEALRQAQARHTHSGMSAEQWAAFLLDYKGPVDNDLAGYVKWVDGEIAKLKGTTPAPGLDAHENGPRVCSFFGPTNLVRSGESPLGILALDTLQRGRRLAERGRVIVPCKDWPSATAYGGCGLDKGLSPGPRLPPRDRRQGPLARANSGSANLSTPGSIPVSVEGRAMPTTKRLIA